MEARSIQRDTLAYERKFSSPHEELAYLREQIAQKERALAIPENDLEKGRVAKREIQEYREIPSQKVLHEPYIMPEYETVSSALRLEPETHDNQMEEMMRLIAERGVKNTLSVIARMKNPHLEDDLHRILVRYIAEGLPLTGMPAEKVQKALNLSLFQIEPQESASKESSSLEETLGSSEQLLAGLASLLERGETFSLEIAVAQGSEHVVFYVAVPSSRAETAQKLIHSIFPEARVDEKRGDYNIFNEEGDVACAAVMLQKHPALPIKTYHSLKHDPLNIILSSFAKLAKHKEGAAIQLVVGSEKDRFNSHYAKILSQVEKGSPLSEALRAPETILGDVMHDIARSVFSSSKESHVSRAVDDAAREQISRKISTRILPTTIRLVASASTKRRAEEILADISSSLSQFDDAKGNSVKVIEPGRFKRQSFIRDFTYRVSDSVLSVPLNLSEITGFFHLALGGVHTSRELKRARGKEVPAPVEMPQEGIQLGINTFGGTKTQVKFGEQDRLRHCYVVGQTGTGKTTIIKNMIIQDIVNGDGVAFIDPHGNDIDDILSAIPQERLGDVIYFDPAYSARPMGLNVLEYDPARPEMKTLIVDEVYGMFRKMYSDVPEAFGPMFEQYYRNATMLVMDDPETGNTLMEIPRVFASSEFRNLKISRCKNPVVVQFWKDIAEKTGGEHSLENMVPWITSKFDVFLSNDIMRPIVAQEESAFNFKEIMDGKKIFLANLSKGRLGERNMALLGLVLVSKFTQAAFARDISGNECPPFYLYIDEFQNFTTPSISTILSEARKYKLSLTVAHQFMAQLDDKIKSAVIGNVGTKIAFRVGTTDAEFLAKQFEPVFSASDLETLENYTACVSLLVSGTPAKPFSLRTEKPKAAVRDRVDAIKELSYRSYGRSREDVESEIRSKFERPSTNN